MPLNRTKYFTNRPDYSDLDADYQMLINSGEYEPSRRPKKAIFRCVMSIYFSPFFIDQPVVSEKNTLLFSMNRGEGGGPDP